MLWPGRQACHFIISVSKLNLTQLGISGQNMALITEVIESRCDVLSFVANLMLYQSSIHHFFNYEFISFACHRLEFGGACFSVFVFHLLNNVPNRSSSSGLLQDFKSILFIYFFFNIFFFS